MVKELTAMDIEPFVTAMQKAPAPEQLDDWANAGPALNAEAISAITEVATARSTMPSLLSIPCPATLRWLPESMLSFCMWSISFIISAIPFRSYDLLLQVSNYSIYLAVKSSVR
jgi:hypothetical protein